MLNNFRYIIVEAVYLEIFDVDNLSKHDGLFETISHSRKDNFSIDNLRKLLTRQVNENSRKRVLTFRQRVKQSKQTFVTLTMNICYPSF